MIPPGIEAFVFMLGCDSCAGADPRRARGALWLCSDECDVEPCEMETSRWHEVVVGVGRVDSAPEEDIVRVGDSAGTVVPRLLLLFACVRSGGCACPLPLPCVAWRPRGASAECPSDVLASESDNGATATVMSGADAFDFAFAVSSFDGRCAVTTIGGGFSLRGFARTVPAGDASSRVSATGDVRGDSLNVGSMVDDSMDTDSGVGASVEERSHRDTFSVTALEWLDGLPGGSCGGASRAPAASAAGATRKSSTIACDARAAADAATNVGCTGLRSPILPSKLARRAASSSDTSSEPRAGVPASLLRASHASRIFFASLASAPCSEPSLSSTTTV